MTKGLSFGADNTLAAQGDATWTLFAPAVFRTLKMNDVQRAAAVESARSSRITLVAEVKKAFYNILLAEQSLEVLRESQATVQRTWTTPDCSTTTDLRRNTTCLRRRCS